MEQIAEVPIIEIHNLTKIYRTGEIDVPALRGVNLLVTRGEFVCIMGPSGSGKSTLFYIVGGLTRCTSGTIRIEGRDLVSMTDAERTNLRKTTIGFVFQTPRLLPALTAEENIAVAHDIAGHGDQIDPEFYTVLSLLGIEERLHHKPKALSGGEQQRVAIARAIINRPAILLADEPTGSLDLENSKIVLGLLSQLNRGFGQTILMITHNPEAAVYASRIVRIEDGRIVE